MLNIISTFPSDLKIFIGGNKNSVLMTELNNIIREIESIATDNFSIEIVFFECKFLGS